MVLRKNTRFLCRSSLFSATEQGKDQKRERWNFDDERVLLQLWADNLEKVESKDSQKTWQNIAKALNEKQELQKN